jgi:hypothetical protein
VNLRDPLLPAAIAERTPGREPDGSLPAGSLKPIPARAFAARLLIGVVAAAICVPAARIRLAIQINIVFCLLLTPPGFILYFVL